MPSENFSDGISRKFVHVETGGMLKWDIWNGRSKRYEKINDKEQAMYIAKRFQKRMLIPKIFLFP